MDDFDQLSTSVDDIQKVFQDPEWGASQLRRIAIFKDITEDELVELYKVGEVKECRAKSNIVIEGEDTRGFYIVLSGKVSVYKKNPNTNAMVRLAFLEKGAVFGEISLFEEAPRSATVCAESKCFLFCLDEEIFSEFMDIKGDNLKARFFKKCAEDMAERFRKQNTDYIVSQQLLWKFALRKDEESSD